MSRIPEVPQGRQTLFVRLARWIAKRRLKRDIGPMKVMSHHPGVMFGTAMMETALERSRLVPQRIKALAEIQAARLIGCPF